VPLDYDMLMALPPWEIRQDYGRRDTMLYALGAGAGIAPDELDLVYEPTLQALPSMAVVLAYPGFWQKDPRYGLTWQKLLHGEQWLRIHRPIPVEGAVTGTMRIEEIYDKGADRGALLLWRREIADAETGEAIATVRGSSFLRADGGFGGTATGAPAPRPIPDRTPDRVVELATRPEQALIYRLSGDYNPLHADPEVARAAGFDRPILHGLCSYAVACRAIVKLCCAGDGTRLRAFDVRFSAPVYPGETLRVEIWDEGAFRVIVAERGITAINNGYFEHD
jgi:acyl dehydratase